MADRPVGRVAVVNWTRRRAAGIETYVEFLLSALAARDYQVGLWAEQDDPADRTAIAVPAGCEQWCAAGDDDAIASLARWSPDVLVINGVGDHRLQQRLLPLAPSIFIAHTYTGTCISGGKTLSFPREQPCGRTFGAGCLVNFYPRRCGGLHPVTMARDYRRQSAQLTAIRSHARVLTLSEHMRREYLHHGLGAEQVQALPQFWPAVANGHQGERTPEAWPTTLFFAGRLDRLKGCHLLLDALPIVQAALGRPLRLIVAGDGPDRARCETLAARVRSAQIDIDFAGWLQSAERTEVLARTRVFVMPSLWPEPYGLSGLEAAVAGVPVAAFAVGAIPEWLDPGIGRLAPADPPSAAGLAAAIVECLAMPRPAVGDTAIRRARHVDALESVLTDVAVRHRDS